MPDNWGLPSDQKISLGLENQKIKLINRCKFMIFVHGIRDIPKHFLDTNKNYSLKYSFLDQTVKYSLNLKNAQDFEDMLKLKIDKIKIMYFFTESRQNIVTFIKN